MQMMSVQCSLAVCTADPGCCVRSEAARNGRQIVPKQAYAQLRVAAAFALRALHHAAPRAHDEEEDAAPAKRQKARCCLGLECHVVSLTLLELHLLFHLSGVSVSVNCCFHKFFDCWRL